MSSLNNYPYVTLDSKNRLINIRDYIHNINNLGRFGGELEISIAALIYNINIATYDEVSDNGNNFIGLLMKIKFNDINKHS